VTVLREAGITACPRCAAIHSSEDHFCPNCGLSMSRHVDLPVAGAATGTPPAASAPPPSTAPAPVPSASPQPAPAQPVPAAPPALATGGQSTPAPVPPTPPSDAHPPVPAHQPEREEATEIIRPGASGS
jgi:hypothetical protein